MAAFGSALTLMFASIAVASGYTATEIVSIQWGDGPQQLKICEPEILYDAEDSTVVHYSPCAGPGTGFVDKSENCYFELAQWQEFKVFRSDGSLLVDLSEGAPSYRPEFYRQGVAQFYVDSLCRIYLNGGWGYDYITVVDTLGNLVDKLSPYGVGSGRRTVTFYRSSDDALLLRIKGADHSENVSWAYRNGSFTPGGCHWMARDGNCYLARKEDSLSIRFRKFGDRDSIGPAGWEQVELIPYPIPMANALLLAVDDDMRLYVDIILPDADERVAVYDSLYELQTEIVFPVNPFEASRYEWSLAPFVRRDGNVYEFRCLDDGMHIIRWKRE